MPAGSYFMPRLSPDGRLIVLTCGDRHGLGRVDPRHRPRCDHQADLGRPKPLADVVTGRHARGVRVEP